MRSSVVLPQPEGPSKREELAGGDVERHAVDRRRGGAREALHHGLDAQMSGGRRGVRRGERRHVPVFTLVQARVRNRSYCGVAGLSKNSRARISAEG